MMLFGSPSFYDPFEYPMFTARQPQRQRGEVYSPRQYFPSSLMRGFDEYTEYCPCGCGRPVTREPARPNPAQNQSRRAGAQQKQRKRNHSDAPVSAGNIDQAASPCCDDALGESGANMEADTSSLSSPGRGSSHRKSVNNEEFPEPEGGESPSDITELGSGRPVTAPEADKERNDTVNGENLEYFSPGIESEEKMDSVSEMASEPESMGESADTDSNNEEDSGEDNTETNNDFSADDFRARQFQAIQTSLKQLNELKLKMDEFNGAKGSKDHLYLEEMLMRCLLSLDNIESQGNDEIRSARKQAVREIQNELRRLETRVSAESNM